MRKASEWTMLLVATLGVAGCSSGSSSPSTGPQNALMTRLKVGMTEAYVAATLGKPAVFRRGSGHSEDVAIYKFRGTTMTLYFSGSRLVRARSSRQPVNR